MTTWHCGECEATTEYKAEFDDDVPPGWYFVETQAMHFVMCSAACLNTFVQSELVATQVSPSEEAAEARILTEQRAARFFEPIEPKS